MLADSWKDSGFNLTLSHRLSRSGKMDGWMDAHSQGNTIIFSLCNGELYFWASCLSA